MKKPLQSIDALLYGYPVFFTHIIDKLRTLIFDIAPDSKEFISQGWKLIGYQNPHYFCSISLLPHEVRLSFENGSTLEDYQKLLLGAGKHVRYVTITAHYETVLQELRPLILQASRNKSEPTKTRQVLLQQRPIAS